MTDEKTTKNPILDSILSGDIANTQEQFRAVLMTLMENNAIFKTKVQRGGRISIPEAERDVMGISEGDIVQVVLAPIKKKL